MSTSDDHKVVETPPPKSTLSQKWTRTLQAFTKQLLKPFLALSYHAATHPKTYIVSTIIFSIGIMVIGLNTNFNQETDDDIWTPQGSKPVEHGNWIEDDSNFPKEARNAVIIVHRNGKNLFGEDGNSLALESTQRVFEALDHFRETPRYDELCEFTDYIHPVTKANTCQIVGISTFWNDSTSTFEADAVSNEGVLASMSAEFFPSGGVVDRDQLIGFNAFDDDGILNYGQSYVTVLFLPPDEEGSEAFSEDFESDAVDRMLDLQDKWNAESGNDFKVEIIVERSFEDEFSRAVTKGRRISVCSCMMLSS